VTEALSRGHEVTAVARDASRLDDRRYRLGGDRLLVAEDGRSHISMEDFAVAILDEAEKAEHPRQRFTAAY
jgi:putative NADH-flavin reductase